MAKYIDIKNVLKERIVSNYYPVDLPLPTEPELAEELGVARMTLRRAMDELEKEGSLRREQGRGSYPTGRRFYPGFFESPEFGRWAETTERRTVVLSVQTTQATPEVGALLDLPEHAPVLTLRRQRWAAGRPLMVEHWFISAALIPDAFFNHMTADSLYEVLISLGLTLSHVQQDLQAVSLNVQEAEALNVQPGTPAFLLRRTVSDAAQRVLHVKLWFSGDAPAFHAVFNQ
ncbi:GntR family transcriptional regulator [Deinococcus detaillensis]|uniref:GntR family transcriptional regulator n=1 Tax=Deinococcus detaillensis TaxID=2592048 RepID=UPI00163DE58A|nr:GntR family transcriptional regulator [Deinococcus detaillensis]